MTTLNIVAIYASRDTAESARARLIDTGVSRDRIRVSNAAGNGHTSADAARGDGDESWMDWLFGSTVSSEDRDYYGSSVTGERTAVSVLADATQAEKIEHVLDELAPIDLHEDTATAGSASQATSSDALRQASAGNQASTGSKASAATKSSTGSQEQVIPIVKEDVEVGKRSVEKRHRIRTRVIEEPIDKAVSLRDERTVIERRPPSATTKAGDIPEAGERDIEVVERHEEPLVSKTTKPVEEVVVKKEVGEHTEHVRDTARHTEVEVDEESTGNATKSRTPGPRT